MILLVAVAFAGPDPVERAQARHEAREIELLGRSTCRPGVPEQAVARYLDRYAALDTAPVRRIEAWGATMEPVAPPPVEPAPETPDLAIPAR